MVDPSSPRDGEKASYYLAVCLETGEVERMELEGNSNGGDFGGVSQAADGAARRAVERDLGQCPSSPGRGGAGPPGHPGVALAPSEPPLSRGRALPSYSPDFNADEATWGWVRQEVATYLCLGAKATVQDKVGDLFARLADRREEVKRRCRTVLQARAEELTGSAQTDFHRTANVYPTLVSV